ncbi:MAG TPA: hypothetical protein VMV25_10785 [Steroidobacteraceae bacterium]|nr:hypothetical protein [Steroidobacteraceae bacterium]
MLFKPHWLLMTAAVSVSALAGAPPAPPAPPVPPAPLAPTTVPAPSHAPATKAPPSTPPDEGLIEFLGADDVPNAAWWDFMNRQSPPTRTAPPAGSNP